MIVTFCALYIHAKYCAIVYVTMFSNVLIGTCIIFSISFY
jgi:hypothetical protein